jgi:hypothetical protein
VFDVRSDGSVVKSDTWAMGKGAKQPHGRSRTGNLTDLEESDAMMVQEDIQSPLQFRLKDGEDEWMGGQVISLIKKAELVASNQAEVEELLAEAGGLVAEEIAALEALSRPRVS